MNFKFAYYMLFLWSEWIEFNDVYIDVAYDDDDDDDDDDDEREMKYVNKVFSFPSLSLSLFLFLVFIKVNWLNWIS